MALPNQNFYLFKSLTCPFAQDLEQRKVVNKIVVTRGYGNDIIYLSKHLIDI